MEKTELEIHLTKLRDKLSQAQKAESLFVCHHCGHKHEGYDFLRTELLKVAEALKSAAVSPKSLESQVDHATNVGGYNVITSLLGLIEGIASRAPKLAAQVQQVEGDNAEELERLGK